MSPIGGQGVEEASSTGSQHSDECKLQAKKGVNSGDQFTNVKNKKTKKLQRPNEPTLQKQSRLGDYFPTKLKENIRTSDICSRANHKPISGARAEPTDRHNPSHPRQERVDLSSRSTTHRTKTMT